MSGILENITVIDLTQNVAGPYCTQMLGDLGASIIKVERPRIGDDTREWNPPSWQGESATFLALNRNKKSICIDLNDPKGQEIVKQLAASADVFVHSMKPGSAEARGLGYEQLAATNPSLIYASISAFGDEGPLRNHPGYDPLIQAYSGIMSITGNPGDDPSRVGVSIIDMASGMWSLIGILTSLYHRSQRGKGSKVANSLLETGIAWVTLPLSGYLATGKVPTKIGTATQMIAPYEVFKTQDDWVVIAAGNDRLFTKLCLVLDTPDLAEDVRFKTNADRVTNRNVLHQLIEARTSQFETANLVHILREGAVPCSPIHTLENIYEDQQVHALNLIKEVGDFRVSDFKIVDLPFRINEKRSQLNLLPPSLGEHTREILTSLGYSQSAIETLKSEKVIG